MKITTKLTIEFLLISLLPIFAVFFMISREVGNAMRKESLEKIYLAVEEKESQIENFLARQMMDTLYLARDGRVIALTKRMVNWGGDVPPEEQKQAYNELKGHLTNFTDFHGGPVSHGGIYLDVMVADLQGHVWVGVYNPPDEGGNEGDAEWFQQGRRALYLGKLAYSPTMLQVTQTSAAPIIDADQETIGVLQIEIDISVIERIIRAQVEMIGKTARLYVLGSDGKVVVKSHAEDLSARNMKDFVQKSQETGESAGGIFYGTNRDPLILTVHPVLGDIQNQDIRKRIRDLGLAVVSEIEKEEATAPIKSFERRLWFAVVLVGLFVIGISIVQSRSFTRPIREITSTALRLGKGEDMGPVDIKTGGEIGELAASFNQMAKDIRGKTVSKDYVENIIKNMTEALVVTDPKGGVVFVNAAFTALLRYKLEEIKGQDIRTLFEQDLPFLTGPLTNKEAFCRVKFHKSSIPVAVSSSPMQGREGEVEGHVVTIADRRIIELLLQKERDLAKAAMVSAELEKARAEELKKTSKELERAQDASLNIMEDLEIARRNLEKEKAVLDEQKHALERANLELDSFVYTASHDLRAPLRGISSFSSFLQERYKDKLDDRGVHYLDRIVNGTRRMTQLIDDLLTLSRISRQKNPYEDVAIAELIQSVLSRIEFDIEQHKVELIIQKDLPVICCDKIKMAEVFLNLINNAIKFSSKGNKEHPKVEIGYQDAGEYHQFSVKDNGIGIEPQYHEQIFGIFKRLHTAAEYEGTGAGLSIVKRVIDDHHGSIRIDSDLGRGATFFFTVPKNIEQRRKKIGEILVEKGLITEEDLGEGLRKQGQV